MLVANSLYHLTNDGAVTALPALYPVLRTAIGFGYAEAGLLTAVGLAVTVVFQLAFGALVDRYGSRALLPAGIAWLGTGMLLMTTATTFGALFLFVALARVGAGAYHPAGISWISREFRGAAVDRAMGVQSSFGDLGVLLGLLPAGFLAGHWGWQGVFLFWGGLNLAAAVAGFAVTAEAAEVRTAANPRASPLKVLRGVAPWIVPLATGGGVFTIVVAFGPLFVTDRLDLSPAVADATIALWIVTGALAAFSFGRISRRFGRFRSLQYAFLAVAVGGVLVATAGRVLVVLLGLSVFVALLFITYPALFSFISDLADVRAQGIVFGTIFGFQLVGGALAASVSGWWAEATNDPAAPFFVLSAIALATFAYLFALREVRAAAGTTMPVKPVP